MFIIISPEWEFYFVENSMPDTPKKTVISGREDLKMTGHVTFPQELRGAPVVVASAAAYSWDTNHPEDFRIFDAQVLIGRVTTKGFDYKLRGQLAGSEPSGWTHSNLLYYIATD
jgi:H-type lectin domain-containing protein